MINSSKIAVVKTSMFLVYWLSDNDSIKNKNHLSILVSTIDDQYQLQEEADNRDISIGDLIRSSI